MPIETRRKTIQNETRRWGDPVVSKPYTTSPGRNSEPSSSSSTSASEHLDTPPSAASAPGSPSESNLAKLKDQVLHNDQAREPDQHISDDTDAFGISIDATSKSGFAHPKNLNMPSTKGWSLDSLVSQSSNFYPVRRVSATNEELQVVMKKFEVEGKPLVIEGFQRDPRWPQDMFTVDYFIKHAVSDEITARNVHKWTDTRMKLSKFVEKCRSVSPYAEENEQERFYGKDTECPKTWEDWLRETGVVPSSLIERGPEDVFRHVPESRSVQTLMCYLGIGDTFTPCHKDLCASSGQNLMCYTENNGSSFWFMTRGSSAPEAAKYFHALGQELDHENHVITLRELAKAPFDVYILEQKLGDLVLVPPRSCHQVVNFGGMTIKTSWSRMTVQGLSTAYHHELPLYRRVCRPEIYRVKSTIYRALIASTKELEALLILPTVGRRLRRNSNSAVDPRPDFLARDLKELLPLFDCVLVEEYEPTHSKMRPLTSDSNDNNPITCDFCGGDIFQSFFECRECTEGGSSSGDCLHICPGCYSEGRSCKCPFMRPRQNRDFQELLGTRSRTEQVIRLHEERRGQTYVLDLDLENASVPALFRAAFFLNQVRKNTKRKTKVCTLTKANETPHECHFHWVLSCKKCHSGKCFWHIVMDSKVHSVEAILTYISDESHTSYHSTHLNGKTRFEGKKRSLEDRQKQGSRSVSYSQLVYNAINFVHCKPVSPRFMKLGWYDRKYTILVDADDPVPSSPSPVSTLFEEMTLVEDMDEPQSINNITLSDDEMLVSDVHTTEKRHTAKKRPSVYVLVPSAPYSIRQALNDDNGESDVESGLPEVAPPKPSSSRSRHSPHVQVSTEPRVTSAALGRPSPQIRYSSQFSEPVNPESAAVHSPAVPGLPGQRDQHAPQILQKGAQALFTVATPSSSSVSRPGQKSVKTNVRPGQAPYNGVSKKSLAKLRFKKITGGQLHESRSEPLDDSALQHASSSSPAIPMSMNSIEAYPPGSQDQPLPILGPPSRTLPNLPFVPIQPSLSQNIDTTVSQTQDRHFHAFSSHSEPPFEQASTSTSIPVFSMNHNGHIPVPQGQGVPTYPHFPAWYPPEMARKFVHAIGAVLMEQSEGFHAQHPPPAQHPPSVQHPPPQHPAQPPFHAQYTPNANANQVQTNQPTPMYHGGYAYPDPRQGGSRSYPSPRGRNIGHGSPVKGSRGFKPRAESPSTRNRRYSADTADAYQPQEHLHANARAWPHRNNFQRGPHPSNKSNRHFHHPYNHRPPYPRSVSTGKRNNDLDGLERLAWDRDEHDIYLYHQQFQLERGVTYTTLVSPDAPGQTNHCSTSTQSTSSPPVYDVHPTATLGVAPEVLRGQVWDVPATGKETTATHEKDTESSEDTEMRTPTTDLLIIDDDETFPEQRGDSEMSPSAADGNLEPSTSMLTDDSEMRVVQDGKRSEMRPWGSEPPSDAYWEDDYDQSDEQDSSPRQTFRLETRTGDKDGVGIGDDELTKNNWL